MNQKTTNMHTIRSGKLPESYFDKLRAMINGVNDKGSELSDAIDEFSAAAEQLSGLVAEYNQLREELKTETSEIADEVRGASEILRSGHEDDFASWAEAIEELGEYEEFEFEARDTEFKYDVYDHELYALDAVKEAELTEIKYAPTVAESLRLAAINLFRSMAGLPRLSELPKEE